MKLTLRFDHINQFFYMVIFKLVLDFIYLTVISDVWGYFFFDNQIDSLRIISNNLLFLFLAVSTIIIDKNRPSDYLLLILFGFIIIPIIVYHTYNTNFSYFSLFIYVGQYVFLLYFNYFLKSLKIFKKYFKDLKSFFPIALFFVLVPLSIIIMNGGFDNWNLNPELVYEFRDSLSSQSVLTGTMAYITMWGLIAFSNYLILYSFLNNKKIILFVLLFIYFLWYGLTGHKSFLLYPFFSIFM